MMASEFQQRYEANRLHLNTAIDAVEAIKAGEPAWARDQDMAVRLAREQGHVLDDGADVDWEHHRRIWRCRRCGHVLRLEVPQARLSTGGYWSFGVLSGTAPEFPCPRRGWVAAILALLRRKRANGCT